MLSARYKKGKINLDFSEARDSEWQWHRLDHTEVCTSLQTDNHANTSLLSFLPAPHQSVFYRPDSIPAAHSIKALKATILDKFNNQSIFHLRYASYVK